MRRESRSDARKAFLTVKPQGSGYLQIFKLSMGDQANTQTEMASLQSYPTPANGIHLEATQSFAASISTSERKENHFTK